MLLLLFLFLLLLRFIVMNGARTYEVQTPGYFRISEYIYATSVVAFIGQKTPTNIFLVECVVIDRTSMTYYLFRTM